MLLSIAVRSHEYDLETFDPIMRGLQHSMCYYNGLNAGTYHKCQKLIYVEEEYAIFFKGFHYLILDILSDTPQMLR